MIYFGVIGGIKLKKQKNMNHKRIIHKHLMNEHRRLANEIADIKAES
jgi:hypothetical protein